jgi:acyl-coenzyme A synthetase/AMP-(fatty) acid ligase
VAIAAIGRVSAEITQHLFQVPRKVIFLPELSRNPTEKVIKDELRRLILDRDEGDRE